MTFDDRLATIIAVAPTSAHDRAVRWRQLVDLVARAGPHASGPLIDQAVAAIRRDQQGVQQNLRAATARAIAGRALPQPLLEVFAADRLDVVAPLLTGAEPSGSLRQAASSEVRRFLDVMYPAPLPEPLAQIVELSAAPIIDEIPTISEVVARIERLRTSRAQPPDPAPQPIVRPLNANLTPAERSTVSSTSPALFRWECGAGGNIAWVEGAPRGPLVGRSIARAEEDGVDREVERAFARRSPFRDATLSLPEGGSIAGRWLFSGVPAFAPADGRFVGYRGIARREEVLKPAAMIGAPATLDPAALRELVHEIKTPLNAIIGFAEIIEGQYLGPAQSGYRERAVEIVSQARVLLTAVDDLDFAARAGGESAQPAMDFAVFFPVFAERLRAQAEERGVTLVVDAPADQGSWTLDLTVAERLLERFAGAVMALATDGEALRLAVRRQGDFATFRLSRPRALERASAAELFEAQPDSSGLSLRLVLGLAQIVGGKLNADGSDLVLHLPVVG